jgi:uncharacterized protein (DUF1684 family)
MTDTTSTTTISTSRYGGYRERRDKYFASHANSPLTAGQKERFQGLAYFDENPDLAFEAHLDTTGPGVGEALTISGMDGKPKEYIRAGRIHFEVDGESVTLSVFRDVARGRYFLPFRDLTAGHEAYPVGRYLDPQARPDGTLQVDFNYAYNPYCAYSDGWTCPVPPFENMIRVRLAAGEKSYPDQEHGIADDAGH